MRFQNENEEQKRRMNDDIKGSAPSGIILGIRFLFVYNAYMNICQKILQKFTNTFSCRYDFQQRSQPLKRFHKYLMPGCKKFQSEKIK